MTPFNRLVADLLYHSVRLALRIQWRNFGGFRFLDRRNHRYDEVPGAEDLAKSRAPAMRIPSEDTYATSG